MPITLCLEPGCPEESSYRGRCRTHSARREADLHRLNLKVYNRKRWKMARRRQLSLHPLCRCGEIATDVDYITPINEGGDPWFASNLQSLCHSCHSTKTRGEQRR